MSIQTTIREYGEELPVNIAWFNKRLVIVAANEAGFNTTQVDLIDTLEFVRCNLPETWNTVNQHYGEPTQT